MSLYGHAFATCYDPVIRGLERRRLADRRARLLEGLTGHVVDVGAGTGANLAHLPPGVNRVTAVEPDAAMAARLRGGLVGQTRHRAHGRHVEVVDAVAEALPLPDASADAVLVTLVLCSVDAPALALSEIRRVLREDGVLVVIEHVRADTRLPAAVQGLLTPAWRRLARGCHLDRDIRTFLEEAGFDLREVEAWQMSRRGPTVPAIAGHARPR